MKKNPNIFTLLQNTTIKCPLIKYTENDAFNQIYYFFDLAEDKKINFTIKSLFNKDKKNFSYLLFSLLACSNISENIEDSFQYIPKSKNKAFNAFLGLLYSRRDFVVITYKNDLLLYLSIFSQILHTNAISQKLKKKRNELLNSTLNRYKINTDPLERDFNCFVKKYIKNQNYFVKHILYVLKCLEKLLIRLCKQKRIRL